jgi:hypothetical protein
MNTGTFMGCNLIHVERKRRDNNKVRGTETLKRPDSVPPPTL